MLQYEPPTYRLLAEQAVDMISLHAADSTYRYVSPACQHVLGHVPEALEGQPVEALCHPEDAAALKRTYRSLRQGSETERTTCRLRHKDGGYVWMETTNRAIRSGSGTLEHVVAVSREVTDRFIQQERIERQAIRLDILREISLSTLRAETPPAIAEAALTRLADLVPFHSASVAAFDPVAGQARLVATAGMARCAALDRPMPLEAFAPAPSARKPRLTYVANLSIRKHRTMLQETLYRQGARSYTAVPAVVAGHALGVLVVTRDAPHAFSADDLAVLKEGTGLLALALQQAQYREALRAAKEEAETMSRLKSTFLANMSHEIRTPLTTILGFADLLADMIEGEPRDLLQIIQQSSRRLQETLLSVLELAELESGMRHPQCETVDLHRAVEDVLLPFGCQAREKGLVLQVEAPTQPLTITTDPTALRRVLTNLISNAVKFTEDGRVTIRITSECDAVCIAVADTGIGIDPAFVPRLFDAFKQESVGLTRSYTGVGIGLSITRQLVDMMGGSLEVESEKGEGSVFTICLPHSNS